MSLGKSRQVFIANQHKRSAVIALQNDDGVKLKPSSVIIRITGFQSLSKTIRLTKPLGMYGTRSFLDIVQKTSTDKVYYQKLKQICLMDP